MLRRIFSEALPEFDCVRAKENSIAQEEIKMKLKVELTMPTDLKDVPVIYYLGHKFKIIPNIIEASFSTDTGWASLVLEGEEPEIKKAIDYLKSQKVTVNII
ncbi:MAG: NIL domain-containing protein [Candidatus Omnitrophota bacterium]